MAGRPVLTAAELRAAEDAAIAAGTSVETLMERAGAAVAEAASRFAGPMPALVLCGPGNNGGDGYVIARLLRERGLALRVAASAPPVTDAAKAARAQWEGQVEELATAAPAPLLIDALFGTGLGRPLEPALSEALARLGAGARVRVAVDLPSGAASDDGALLSPVPDFDLTIALGALKPSHLLQPAARRMGRLVVADIGIHAPSNLHEIARPRLAAPGPDDHKYRRGCVAVLAGEMPGASALTASAAARAGTGYVRLVAGTPVAGVPAAVVQGGDTGSARADARIDVIIAGPGLGRGEAASRIMEGAMADTRPRIVDADALWWLAANPRSLAGCIVTPHEGEFMRLFGSLSGSKSYRARQAARSSGAVVVYKGADTVVATPDGRAAIGAPAPAWLASAGTGDVLAGIVAAMRARGFPDFEAACAAVWLQSRAAALAGPWLVADDLVAALPRALAECL